MAQDPIWDWFIFHLSVINRIILLSSSPAPLHQDIHVLIPSSCEFVTLRDKMDFAMMKGMIKDIGLELGRLLLIFQVVTFFLCESLKSKEPFLTVVRERCENGRKVREM